MRSAQAYRGIVQRHADRSSRGAALLPGLAVLLRYRRGWLLPDAMAGLTVGAMLIPQSMAYAELAGLPPQFGFYAVIGALVVYALVGTWAWDPSRARRSLLPRVSRRSPPATRLATSR